QWQRGRSREAAGTTPRRATGVPWRATMIISHPDETTQALAHPVRSTSADILDKLRGWEECEVGHLKPEIPERDLEHRNLQTGEFWRRIPAYAAVDTDTFLDHSWQARNSATNPKRLRDTIGDLAPAAFYEEVAVGYRRAPMSMRVSPYLLALMNWEDPYSCPLRRQFIPIGSQLV